MGDGVGIFVLGSSIAGLPSSRSLKGGKQRRQNQAEMQMLIFFFLTWQV